MFGEGDECEVCGGLKPLPTFVEHRVPTDGTLGVEFIVRLPESLRHSEFEDSHMEFKVGKGGETITVPFLYPGASGAASLRRFANQGIVPAINGYTTHQ